MNLDITKQSYGQSWETSANTPRAWSELAPFICPTSSQVFLALLYCKISLRVDLSFPEYPPVNITS